MTMIGISGRLTSFTDALRGRTLQRWDVKLLCVDEPSRETSKSSLFLTSTDGPLID